MSWTKPLDNETLEIAASYAVSTRGRVAYPFGKGKKSALKLLEIDIPGLDQVLGQPGATHAQCKATADSVYLPLYGQKSCTTMNGARACFFHGRRSPHHWRNCRQLMLTCSCTCSKLTFRCYFQRQRINGTWEVFWYMGSLDKYAVIADRFDMAESTIVAPSGTCCDSLLLTCCRSLWRGRLLKRARKCVNCTRHLTGFLVLSVWSTAITLVDINGPGLDILFAGRAGSGLIIQFAGRAQAGSAQLLRARAEASNHICGPGLGLKSYLRAGPGPKFQARAGPYRL